MDLTKSKKQQLTNWEIQGKGSFKIEANLHLSIFIIKVCEIYLPYTFKETFIVYLLNMTVVFRRGLREDFWEKVVLRNGCPLI